MNLQWSKECIDRNKWSKECYVEYKFCCDIKQVTENYNKIINEFPYLSWGTHIYKKVFDEKSNLLYLIVRRFVSKEECRRHSTTEEDQE